jgi:hydrogenase maturation protein HypF
MQTRTANEAQGLRIHITGIVQGVGFRPFVYGLARRYGLTGWVRNTSAGVDIEADGTADALAALTAALRDELPPLARIDSLSAAPRPASGYVSFDIRESRAEPGAFQPISPDVAVCDDCLRELFDPTDRRHRYPFINCTNCGPRFTIIRDIPYDRPLTTMAGFPLCADCAAEYADPLDRRFHAQPVACPVCGPRLWLERPGQVVEVAGGEDALQATRALLSDGGIVAVKGLGGFHLACDATNATAVTELRRRKLRVGKPFAVMLPDLAAARRHCNLSAAEEELLLSRARPIVVAHRRADSTIAAAIAPEQSTIGIMLPYTPLHYLLLARAPGFPEALVMTSGNLSEEPIAHTNEAARERLAGLADAFLFHDRDIQTRCDDSVMRVVAEESSADYADYADFLEEERDSSPTNRTDSQSHTLPLRRSRGYAPYPVRLPWAGLPLLAVGAELKNTFCLTRDDYAFLSHHIGDLENYETLLAFEDGVAHLERLFRVRPEAIAYDLHPDYLATRYALERAAREGLPAVGVQHHHAHIAAGMAEHGLPRDAAVIGVAFDGTGYGDDGAIWGGEFLVAGYGGYQRAAHLRYVPLPGGDRAVREPWRVALAWLDLIGQPWADDLPSVREAGRLPAGILPADAIDRLAALRHQLAHRLNSPLTSSMGRLFDAAAALAGVRQTVSYEAQAAIEFEAAADANETAAYEFDYHWPAGAMVAAGGNGAGVVSPSPLSSGQEIGNSITRIAAIGYAKSADEPAALQIDPTPVLAALLADQRAGLSLGRRAARFHNGVALMTRDVCRRLRHAHGLNDVVLSGGVWQNVTLLRRALALLRADGFIVYTHRLVPPNDGGLALGQAAVGNYELGIRN